LKLTSTDSSVVGDMKNLEMKSMNHGRSNSKDHVATKSNQKKKLYLNSSLTHDLISNSEKKSPKLTKTAM
jgi:hypothetical protein